MVAALNIVCRLHSSYGLASTLRNRGLASSARTLAKASKTFKLADIGEGITECEVLKWSVQAPAKVGLFDQLCEVQSDKATVEITSPFDGTISKILVQEGEIAKVGQGLCVIDVEEDEMEPTSHDPTNASTSAIEEQKPVSAGHPSLPASQAPVSLPQSFPHSRNLHPLDPNRTSQRTNGEVSATLSDSTLATPSVRHYARSKGIPMLSRIQPGSGKHGRIEKSDVDAWLASSSHPNPGLQKEDKPLVSSQEADLPVELGRTRWAMWKAMEKSLNIPHFGYSTILDLTALSQQLTTMNAHIPSAFRPPSALAPAASVSPYSILPSPPLAPESDASAHFTRLTFLPLLIKSLSRAMQEWPLFRSSIVQASLDEKPSLIVRPHSDIAIALSTPSGLYTPTLQSVETKSSYEIMGELRRFQVLGRKVPSGLTLKEMPKRGATVTVSNVGAIGKGEFAAPLLVPGGGVAIVAIGRAKWVERIDGRRLEVGISWSADHRVVEGAEMAAFTESWRSWVEEPGRMIADGR